MMKSLEETGSAHLEGRGRKTDWFRVNEDSHEDDTDGKVDNSKDGDRVALPPHFIHVNIHVW